MGGTQPPLNSNKWWHLKKRKKGTGEKSMFFFILILDKNQKRTGKNKPHLTRLVHQGHVARKIQHTHITECFAISAQFKAPISMFFFFHPSPLQSCYPLPFAIMLTDSTDILRAGDRYVISRGETGLSSAGEYAAPSSSRVDRHTWHFSTLSSLIALWHAGRIKGGIFHMQLEREIKTMKCGVQRKAGDQKAVMKGD